MMTAMMTLTTAIVIAGIASTLTGGVAFLVGYAYGVRSEHDLHERERERTGRHYGGLKL